MAQLKDSIVQGNLRVTDTTLTDTLRVTTIEAPTSSGGSTYGPGSSGQILKSNGSAVYWSSDTDTDSKVLQSLTETANFRPIVLGYHNSTTPSELATTETNQVYTSTKLFMQPSTGNVTMYSAYNDSPALIFRRGTFIDNSLDWKIYNTGGMLTFSQAGRNTSTETWVPVVIHKTESTTKSTIKSLVGIYGATYGNTASELISGTVGVIQYGDGGPQIDFGTSQTSTQRGSLIFTDHDSAATGASFHFVSTESDWNVISKRFHAKTGISVGTTLPTTSSTLYVSGTGNITGNTTIGGNLGVSGTVSAAKYATKLTSQGYYLKDSAGNEYAGIFDNGTNLWLGAYQTAATHHVGRTYISSGYDSTNSVGFSSIYVAVPNADNTNASNYEVLHFGNISAEVTGSGNAVTSVSFANGKVTATKGSTFLTQHPTITKSADTTSSASPSHGGTFTCIDSITRETNGHVTKINTKTVTLPAQYTHPTYTSKTSGLYKITVDGTGHVSATAAVAKGDIPALDYLPTTTKYALSDSVGGDALVAKHLKNIDLNSTNIDAAEGSFAFRGANDPFPNTDWVGLQIGDDRDKFQLITNGSDLAIRFNDTGGSDSTNWTDWSNIIDRRHVTATPSAKTHTDWNTTSERTDCVTKGYLSYWNGAFNSSGSSNLTYCNRGAFGTIVTHSADDYVLKAGDTMTGDLTLYSASGDSPALRFQRGTLTDNLNDWVIKVSGGHLKFQSNVTSTDTYFDALTINASTAHITMKEDAVLRGKLAQHSTSRLTSADLTTKGDASLQMILATSSMTSGKPAGDGYILNMDWDNTGKYQAQMFLPNSYSKVKPPQYRVQNASADWSDTECKWRNFITEDNYTDYTSRFGYVLDESSDFASYPWHKIATTTISNRYNDHEAIFLVQKTWASYEKCVGILAIKMRSGTDYHFESGIFKWIFTGTGINPNDFVAVYTNGTNSYTIDIYVKITVQYDGWRFNILAEGKRHLTTPVWDMIVTGSQHGLATLPAGDGQIVSSRWDAYIPLIGSDDVTGNIKITKTSGDTGFYSTRSDTSTTCWFGVGSGGANHGFYSNKINNWIFAANATNAFVYHTLQNPTSETSYAISFGGNNTAAGTKERFINNGLAYRTKEGTTASAGVSTLILGNTTASGTAGNKSGRIRLYTTSTQYCDIIGYMSSTAYTVTIPPLTGRATIQAKGTTNFYGLADGDGTQGWIRTTNYGFIPSAAGTMKSPHSSLGTATWVFNDAHICDIYGSKLELGQAYTVDSSAIGGSIKMYGDGDETMDTVTLKPADVPGSDNYNITVPMMNGTMSLIDTIETSSPGATAFDNCTIDADVKMLTIVLKIGGTSQSSNYTIQVPKIIGVHDFPIVYGAGPSSGGGSCIITSGFIQIIAGTQSGTYKIIAGRKTQAATMSSSGWTISSPSWTLSMVAVYGIK